MSDEKKSTYTPKRAGYIKKYLSETVEDIKVRVHKGKKAYYKEAAANAGESLNAFVIRAMDYLIEVEKLNSNK